MFPLRFCRRLSWGDRERSRGLKPLSVPVLSRVPRVSPDPLDLREEAEWRYLQRSDPWPDLELFRKLPFDYTVHDPKYEDASLICSHHQSARGEGQAPRGSQGRGSGL